MDLGTAITTALADFLEDTAANITAIAPIGIGVIALLVGWRYVKRVVKSL